MKSWTLNRYLARQYFMWFAAFLFGLSAIIFLFEVAELLRRSADVPGITFSTILKMGFYKLPNTIEKVLPFVVLFSGMFTFWRMTRSQELIVARAAGVSVWQFLAPAFVVTVLFAFFNIAVLNPLGAAMNASYKQLEMRYLQRSAALELTGAGLWLRQSDALDTPNERHYLLHADHVDLNPLMLEPLIAFVYDKDDRYLGRIDAARATLHEDNWLIEKAWFNWDGQAAYYEENYTLPTSLTFEKIQESMAPPNTISLWALPGFIEALEAIGLPATRHELQFQSLLAEPLLLGAMVFFAAAFSLRLTRRGGVFPIILAGLLTGSAIFLLNNVTMALGANQTLPVLLAAWALPFVAFAVGSSVLLHLEDG